MNKTPTRYRDPATGFYCEDHSRFGMEGWLKRHLLDHIVGFIPASLHPNTISIANHFVAWMAFLAAAAAPLMDPFNALMARLLAAAAVFGCICLDCLDGMHARRTGQSSKLGEVLDHWLDALNLGLYTAAVVLTLGVGPVTAAVGAVTAVMNYNAQLVYYHHSGRFVHPGTSGIDALVAIVGLLAVLGVFFYYVPQSDPRVVLGVHGIAWCAILFINLSDLRFFWVRMKGCFTPHVKFVVLCGAVTAPLLLGRLDIPVYLLVLGFVTFRICGSYVLNTVLRRPYGGADWSIVLWSWAIIGADAILAPYAVRGYPVMRLIPYLFMLYLALLNCLDLIRALGALRAAQSGESLEERDRLRV